MKVWRSIRIALVLTAFIGGVFGSGEQLPNISLLELLVVFLFGPIALLFVVGIQRLNPRSASVWQYPSWSVNPFSMKQPLQPFHLGGFFFLASGLGWLVQQLLRGGTLVPSSFFFLTFGAGIVCGVYLCAIVFKGKMAATNNSLKSDVAKPRALG